MKEIGSPIGGEGNGGVILSDVHLTRDAMVGITLIMQMLTEYDTSIGKLKMNSLNITYIKRSSNYLKIYTINLLKN